MMGVACSGVTKRGVFSTKMKPSASAPASTAVIASRRFVMPQTLTRIMNNGGGETRPAWLPERAQSGPREHERPEHARPGRLHSLISIQGLRQPGGGWAPGGGPGG